MGKPSDYLEIPAQNVLHGKDMGEAIDNAIADATEALRKENRALLCLLRRAVSWLETSDPTPGRNPFPGERDAIIDHYHRLLARRRNA